MARELRKYHPQYLQYQQMIVNHSNYKDMPEAVDTSGSIKWVIAGKSELGKKREEWWIAKGYELRAKGIKIAEHAKLSPIALANHPTKKKACQTCGKSLSLEYVYLTKNTVKAINKGLVKKLHEDSIIDVFELANSLFKENGTKAFTILNLGFPGCNQLNSYDDLICYLRSEFVNTFSKRLGPGAMSNCPDRLDGFHSYNRCCRGEQDTGRHSSNLARYGEDRRAYENWADGDWKAASWLMKVFTKHGVSADHIGPISLGFCHRPVFQPMTKQQNSSKGNRLSFTDCMKLIQEETDGEQIVSWHSAPIWNLLKNAIKNDKDAREASKYMRRNMHYILTIFANLKKAGLSALLESFLNVDYAYYSIDFIGFDPNTGKYKEMQKVRGDITQYSRNAARYKKIAFEQLDEYLSKDNRKISNIDNETLKEIIEKITHTYKQQGNIEAKNILKAELEKLAKTAYIEFTSGKELADSE